LYSQLDYLAHTALLSLAGNGVVGVLLLLLLHRFWRSSRASSSQVPRAKDADELRSDSTSFCSIGP
jgi:Na+-transporting methylmalonyl-CoA/oxaloacetate decarboxylase gamma subunit